MASGYIRRKVTYNIAKNAGRGSNNTSTGAISRGGHKKFTLNPMRLLTQWPDDEDELFCIVEKSGAKFYIDADYLAEGEREGWLVKTGHYRDACGTLVWTVKHIRN